MHGAAPPPRRKPCCPATAPLPLPAARTRHARPLGLRARGGGGLERREAGKVKLCVLALERTGAAQQEAGALFSVCAACGKGGEARFEGMGDGAMGKARSVRSARDGALRKIGELSGDARCWAQRAVAPFQEIIYNHLVLI